MRSQLRHVLPLKQLHHGIIPITMIIITTMIIPIMIMSVLIITSIFIVIFTIAISMGRERCFFTC